MASLSYRTPSPEHKPDLEQQLLTTPTEPQSDSASSGRPRRTPRAPTKIQGFVSYKDYDDDELNEDSENDDEEQFAPSPSKKSKSSKGKAVAKQPKQPKPPKVKVKKDPDVWDDIPQWHDDRCPVFTLPSEILDDILADEALTLRDHLSLAASCRAFRAAYYTPSSSSTPRKLHSSLWMAIMLLRPPANTGNSTRLDDEPTVAHEKLLTRIFSNEKKCPVQKMKVLWPSSSSKKRNSDGISVGVRSAMRSVEWDQAIEMLHSTRATKTDMLKTYKITKKQLEALPCIIKRNPHDRRNPDSQMFLFLEATVEARALRAHGGPPGHQALLEKREATRQKAAATGAKNGTVLGGKKKFNSRYYGGGYDDFDGHDECYGYGYGSGYGGRYSGGYGRRYWRGWY